MKERAGLVCLRFTSRPAVELFSASASATSAAALFSAARSLPSLSRMRTAACSSIFTCEREGRGGGAGGQL